MYGQGIAKGLWITFKHFLNSYADDIRYAGRKYVQQENFQLRQSPHTQGAFTVQYPDEKIAVPERFRFVPFLVVYDDDDPEHAGEDWCTSCGICPKVCPPQCIWIVRGQDPNTGRPVPQPEAFFIDIDICMNCGYCAEFCPFDAIKMDHDYELASYDRTSAHIHDKEKLSKPFSYWKSIAPTRAYEEMEARGGWDHKDVIKEKQKAAKAAPAPKPTAAPVPSETGETVETITAIEPAVEAAAPVEDDAEAKAKAERLAKREAALARKRARQSEEGS